VPKRKFLKERLQRRLAYAEALSGHVRKGNYWTKLAADIKRRIAKVG
jgi:hypothetical protein